jgi:hypothetical protein
MEEGVAVSRWFGTPQLAWSFILISAVISSLLMSLLGQRRRARAVAHRVIALAAETAGVPRAQRLHAQLVQELARARRYEYPLTTVVLSLGSDELMMQTGHISADGGNRKAGSPSTYFTPFTFLFVWSLLRDALRESDIVTYDSIHNQYVILLPEASKPQALYVVRRLQALLYKQTLMSLRAGVAEFPTDGLTIENLVSSARAVCSYQAVNGELRDPAGEKTGEERGSE